LFTWHTDVFDRVAALSLGMLVKNIPGVCLLADPSTIAVLADGVGRKRSRMGNVQFPAIGQSRYCDRAVRNDFANRVLLRFRRETPKRLPRVGLDGRKHGKQ
jgi:hypothetical protein